MTYTARSSRVYQQDGPLGATGARRKRLVAFDEVSAVDFFNARPKTNRFAGFMRLRFTAPGDPLLTAFDDACEPTRLLFFSRHAVEQDERIDVALPATSE